MLLIALIACNGAFDADDVRRELDQPTARLAASSLPEVVDDLFLGQRARGSELYAMNLSGGGSTQGVLPVQGFLGDVGCAIGTAASVRSESCVRGQTCRTRFTFKSCLLGDPLASGRIRFTVEERERRDHDEGSLTIDFRDWQTSGADGTVDHLEGSLEVEANTWEVREELVYVADFTSSVRDPDVRGNDGILASTDVRAALRLTQEDRADGGSITAEVLGWVDEDGDGVDDASVVLRMQASLLEDELEGLTFELVDAAGTWTCTLDFAEEDIGTTTVWTSRGSCTDPSGNDVPFEGVVSR